MTKVKNLAGLAIVLGAFCLATLIFLGLLIFALSSLFGGSFGLLPLIAFGLAAGGLYMSVGVLYYFARNFSLKELLAPDAVVGRHQAPIAIEIKYNKERKRRYLVDSRHSPRATNPKKLGRGVFIMSRKRGEFVQDTDVITLMSSDGIKISNVRDFEDKIHFDMDGKGQTITIQSVTEHSSNFERKDSWDLLEGDIDTKEKQAEAWADALKKT